jgi:hypothetical protein
MCPPLSLTRQSALDALADLEKQGLALRVRSRACAAGSRRLITYGRYRYCPNRPSRPKTISIPSVRRKVCARRRRPARAGVFGQPDRFLTWDCRQHWRQPTEGRMSFRSIALGRARSRAHGPPLGRRRRCSRLRRAGCWNKRLQGCPQVQMRSHRLWPKPLEAHLRQRV